MNGGRGRSPSGELPLGQGGVEEGGGFAEGEGRIHPFMITRSSLPSPHWTTDISHHSAATQAVSGHPRTLASWTKSTPVAKMMMATAEYWGWMQERMRSYRSFFTVRCLS